MPVTKLSDVERIKSASHYLRGTIEEGLADPVTGAIPDDDVQLLKFHGSYQQEDRDRRDDRRRRKLEPAYEFMIRTRLPGGVCSPAQWLALDRLARQYANGSLRLTSRQAFQLHGIIKGNLKPTLAAMNAALVDTIGACGDVNRNVICAANPDESDLHQSVYRDAVALSEHLRPKTRAYHEIWLDREKVAASDEAEPLYGESYLPRKFKTAIALPPINDVEVFAHDLGFIGIAKSGELQGYNVTVGGGMGMSYDDAATHPRLADVIGFIELGQLLATAEAVVSIQRDYGNRADRKHARFKYTMEERGLDWLITKLHERLDFKLANARPYEFEHNGDRCGWVEGEDGRSHLTLHLPAGRVRDDDKTNAMTGLRRIATAHNGEFRLTPNQNLIIANVAAGEHERINALVGEYGLDAHNMDFPARRHALACVALPTCALAMAEAERYLPDFMDKLEALLKDHGLEQEPMTVRISGCPNGCSRPYLAEIALTGKAPGRYNLYLGGNATGERLNVLYRDNADEAEIVQALQPMMAQFARARDPGERFGDFLWRKNLLPSQS